MRSLNEKSGLFCVRLRPARSGPSVRFSTGSSIEGKRVSLPRYCVTVVDGAWGASPASCEDDLGRLEEEAIVG